MLRIISLAAVVAIAVAPAAHAIHLGPPPPAVPPPPALPAALIMAPAAKPHELYTVDTSLSGYNPITDKYSAAVRITSNPCPHVSYDNILSFLAKDPDDALAQAHDQLAKIEQDIRNSAAQCPAH